MPETQTTKSAEAMPTPGTDATAKKKVTPALKLNFISHGTLEAKDLAFTRRFYEEFMGFEVHRRPARSRCWFRLGGPHVYVAVQSKTRSEMPMLNHNGIDVESEERSTNATASSCEHAEKWKLHKISKPLVQHGTYSFYFWDADDNCWEILSNPAGGYTWMFERGDHGGKGHMDKSFKRPGVNM